VYTKLLLCVTIFENMLFCLTKEYLDCFGICIICNAYFEFVACKCKEG